MAKITRPLTGICISSDTKKFDLDNSHSVEQLAWESGYYLQEAKKISASSLMYGFFKMMHGGVNSLRLWALEIGLIVGSSVQKSSLHERLGPRTVGFLEAVLKAILLDRVNQVRRTQACAVDSDALLGKFRHVLLGDSTCQKVPSNLASEFPSSYSHGAPTATARIQTIYNYTAERFERFAISSFRQNDQSATDFVFEVAAACDLVLRDLGYFVLENLRKMTQRGIFFISKYHPLVAVFNAEDGQPINLVEFLSGKNSVDITVLLGAKEKLPVRLVAQKLPREVYQLKEEKARKDRNKKTNHSEDYYKLLKWVIFVTNVPPEMLTAFDVCKIYRIRWFIEVVFKAWKSHFHFTRMLNVPKMNYWRVLVTIYLILIQIAFSSMEIYQYIKNGVEKLTPKPISMLKYMSVLSALIDQIAKMQFLHELDFLIPQFAAHATYEKRIKRKSIKEIHVS